MYPHFHGEKHEGKHCDEILKGYFPDSYNGVFFDVGAFEPVRISNSYHFEKNGWKCYCFEANPENILFLKKERENVFHFAIADEDRDDVEFNSVWSGNNWNAGFSALNISDEYKKQFGWGSDNDSFFTVKKWKVNQRKLDTVIRDGISDLTHIDIMSIDVEGGELNVFKGLDLKKYRPKVILLEVVGAENIIEMEGFMTSFGYRLDKCFDYNQFWTL